MMKRSSRQQNKPKKAISSTSQKMRSATSHASIRGLVTQQQQNMTQSQYTHRTGQTRSQLGSDDFDFNYDQFEKEEIKEVFIDKQQQKVIHKILQIARKGKINKQNAFEIPLKVADQQQFETGQTKFWKFASELLGASINIYDKRIENTWINTNKVHDKLARMNFQKGKDQSEQDEDDQSLPKQSQEILLLPIQQFRNPEILENLQVGQNTLEQTDRINIANIKKQFTQDPLFQKKLKTFDSSSLKALLLNVFNLRQGCQIQLFLNQNKPVRQEMRMGEALSFHSIQKMIEEVAFERPGTQQLGVFDVVFAMRQESEANKKQFNQHKQELKVEAVLNDFDEFIKSQFQSFGQNMLLENQQKLQKHHDFGLYEGETNLEDIQFTTNIPMSQPQNQNYDTGSQFSEQKAFSQYPGLLGSYASSNHDRSFHSVMTPWEIQFKDGKIVKKRVKRQKGKNKRQKVEPGQINFDALIVEKKNIALSKLTQKQINQRNKRSRKQQKKHNCNLIPPQLVTYEKYNYSKIKTTKQAQVQQKNTSQELVSFLAPDISMLEVEPNTQQNVENLETIIEHEQVRKSQMQFEDLMYPKSDVNFYSQQLKSQQLKNIRQMKKVVYEQVCEQRQLILSQVCYGMNPSSVLITFLHLANQKNLVVRNNEQESDVYLTWN